MRRRLQIVPISLMYEGSRRYGIFNMVFVWDPGLKQVKTYVLHGGLAWGSCAKMHSKYLRWISWVLCVRRCNHLYAVLYV